MNDRGESIALGSLREILQQRFSDAELKNLCHDLGIDYEVLPGNSRADRARELIAYLERRGQLFRLVDLGERSRPDILWNDIRDAMLVGGPEELHAASPNNQRVRANSNRTQHDTEKIWWTSIPSPRRTQGDVIVAHIGADSTGVAVGKNITLNLYEVLGEPAQNDRQVIEGKLIEAMDSVEALRGQFDAATLDLARFQMRLLEGELIKTEDEKPSANTITQVGDWLLDNLPQTGEILADLFATPAVGRVVFWAGDVAIAWVRDRFSGK